ncbi:putative helicase mug81 like protein [Verticillium longisporum]|nr:putative helicase mug81 like protein [Verticillium longisporum]
MSRATEYDELPVRHNEDLINSELSRNLPLPATAFNMPMWDPHVKSFLLLQAHFSRVNLPISDYVGDQTSVLDQAIRIIQASIDMLAELGYLSSCLQMMALLQSVKSARWPTDPAASILPGVDTESSVIKEADRKLPLAAITALPQAKLSQLASRLGVSNSQQPRFLKAAAALPNVKVSIPNITAQGATIELRRLNAITEREARIYAPRFPKPQTEGWFVVVGDVAKDEVLAVKRVGWAPPRGKNARPGAAGVEMGSRPTAKSIIKLPESVQGRKVDVLVVSDAYIGLEYRVLGVDVPAPPVVDDDVDKGKKAAAAGPA